MRRTRSPSCSATRRAITVNIGGEPRVLPVEYAGRYRDALGVPLPVGLPESLLAHAPHAAQDLARRYARTHGPFTTADFAARYALGRATAEAILKELAASGRLLEGEFRPGGSGREWCDPDVLQSIRRRSLAKLRKQVEPVEPAVFGRLLTSWQGVVRRRRGSTRCSTRSRTSRARRCRPRSSSPRSSRRGSRATTRPTSTR